MIPPACAGRERSVSPAAAANPTAIAARREMTRLGGVDRARARRILGEGARLAVRLRCHGERCRQPGVRALHPLGGDHLIGHPPGQREPIGVAVAQHRHGRGPGQEGGELVADIRLPQSEQLGEGQAEAGRSAQPALDQPTFTGGGDRDRDVRDLRRPLRQRRFTLDQGAGGHHRHRHLLHLTGRRPPPGRGAGHWLTCPGAGQGDGEHAVPVDAVGDQVCGLIRSQHHPVPGVGKGRCRICRGRQLRHPRPHPTPEQGGTGSSRPEEPKTAPSGARLDRCCSHWRCCSRAAATTMSPPCPPGRNQSTEVDTSTPGSTSCRPRRWPASSRGGSVVWSGPRCRTLSPDRAVRVWIRRPDGVVVSLTRTSGNASSSAANAAHRGGASQGRSARPGQHRRPRDRGSPPDRPAARPPPGPWRVGRS